MAKDTDLHSQSACQIARAVALAAIETNLITGIPISINGEKVNVMELSPLFKLMDLPQFRDTNGNIRLIKLTDDVRLLVEEAS